MEYSVAERKLNSRPVNCLLCSHDHPNYRIALDASHRPICFDCASSPDAIKTIVGSYKQQFVQFTQKMPLPLYHEAEACLKDLADIRNKTRAVLLGIREKVDQYEKDMTLYLDQAQLSCEKYIEKLKKCEEMSFQAYLKKPQKVIDQELFILNMRQRHKVVLTFQNSLLQASSLIPSVPDLVRNSIKSQSKETYCTNIAIVSAVNVRGSLFVGTADGRIIYEKGVAKKDLKAHDGLIRTLLYDGQYTLYSGSDDFYIKAWDLHSEDLKILKKFGHIEDLKSYHRHLALMNNGKLLASSRGQFDEHQIRFWSLDSYENVKTLPGHDSYIKGMVALGEQELVTVSDDRYLKVWNTGSMLCVRQYFHGRKLSYVFGNRAGNMLCAVDEDSRVLFLEARSLRLVNGISVGKKILYANAERFVYVNLSSAILIYNWLGVPLHTIDVGISFTATNILEIGNKLVLTDPFGTVFEYYFDFLKKQS